MPRTRRADCSGPGIARRRRGRGFSYLGPDGRPVDEEALQRIRALAIPPAWTEVWICLDPRGHIQATGVDAAGRKQYRYHDDWRVHRDRAKFDAMVAFAESLPRLRRRVTRDLHADDGIGRERVLACATRLLDLGLFRIGGEDYAARNGTYGLTTLLREHVDVERGGAAVFGFVAKHGVERRQRIEDPDATAIVAALKRRRGGGEELLAWRAPTGSGSRSRWVDVKADDVNAYIKDAAGGDFSAKDFRTWNTTALCAVALAARARRAGPGASRPRIVKAAIAEVATLLGNTPAVARQAYVDPRVLDRFDEGLVLAPALASGHQEVDADEPIPEQHVSERLRRAVLALIAGDRDAPGVCRQPRR